MGRKCCVTGCDGNYKGVPYTVYRLPNKKKSEERERWLRSIPRENIPDNNNTVVCEKHWPPNFETVVVYGKTRPKDPPSVFHCVNPSQIPTAPSKPRSTTRALLSSRASLPDELSTFLDQDKIDSFDDLREKVGTKEINFQVPTITYSSSENLVIQSTELRCGIPYFLLTIKTDLTFEGFNCGVRCTIKSLSTNRITTIDRCTKLIEAVRYLSTLELDDKNWCYWSRFHA